MRYSIWKDLSVFAEPGFWVSAILLLIVWGAGALAIWIENGRYGVS